MPSPMPKVSCTAMPAAKLLTRNSDSSTSGEPSLRAFDRSNTTRARNTSRLPPIDT